jgi:anti-sigma-K factor RskA
VTVRPDPGKRAAGPGAARAAADGAGAAGADGRPSPWQRLPPLWQAGLAAGAVLLIAFATTAAVELARIRALTMSVRLLSARLAVQESALAVVASGAGRTVVLRGSVPGSARFIYDRAAGQAALVAAGLRDPGGARVYQLWLLADGEPRSAGVFRPIPGQPLVLPVRGDLRRYQAVAISIEPGPSGSAGGPTGAPVLTADL